MRPRLTWFDLLECDKEARVVHCRERAQHAVHQGGARGHPLVRAALPPVEFEIASVEGQAMLLDQVIADVLAM
jgi:hypothetical protein